MLERFPKLDVGVLKHWRCRGKRRELIHIEGSKRVHDGEPLRAAAYLQASECQGTAGISGNILIGNVLAG